MFNIHYHGVHHKYGQMSSAAVPEFAAVLAPARPDESAPFPSYWSAFCDMASSLADPRVGAQWLTHENQPANSPMPTKSRPVEEASLVE